MTRLRRPKGMSEDIPDALAHFLEGWERTAARVDFYMPALATHLRIAADEMADRYPDDVNAGRAGAEQIATQGAGG
jgi:hypothetical protein